MMSVFLVLAAFLTVVFVFNRGKRVNEDPRPPIAKIVVEVKVGLPTRLKIPSIAVDADILSVGLAADGSMDVPKKATEVAWFNLGEKPGDQGSAVITGHYGAWKNGDSSVFDNLHELKKGDKIYVEDELGGMISFVVREVRSYDPQADATEVFSSDDERSHLNLITCEGIWNDDVNSFSKRLVVFADRE